MFPPSIRMAPAWFHWGESIDAFVIAWQYNCINTIVSIQLYWIKLYWPVNTIVSIQLYWYNCIETPMLFVANTIVSIFWGSIYRAGNNYFYFSRLRDGTIIISWKSTCFRSAEEPIIKLKITMFGGFDKLRILSFSQGPMIKLGGYSQLPVDFPGSRARRRIINGK